MIRSYHQIEEDATDLSTGMETELNTVNIDDHHDNAVQGKSIYKGGEWSIHLKFFNTKYNFNIDFVFLYNSLQMWKKVQSTDTNRKSAALSWSFR